VGLTRRPIVTGLWARLGLIAGFEAVVVVALAYARGTMRHAVVSSPAVIYGLPAVVAAFAMGTALREGKVPTAGAIAGAVILAAAVAAGAGLAAGFLI
jgi:hypothetical protein